MKKDDNALIGIKAIADYLNMSVRNVYYWEKKLGLPLHRTAGISGHRIYAYKDELDRWLEDKSKYPSKRSKIRIWMPIAIIVPVFLGIALIYFLSVRKKDLGPTTIISDKNLVNIKDEKENLIWHFSHKDVLNADSLKHILDFEDIDNDSQKELVACTYDVSLNKSFLTFFDYGRGAVWRKAISSELTFNGIPIDAPFNPGAVRFAHEKSGRVVIISKWNHMERFLSIIACHDLDGNLLCRYYHTGNLTSTLEVSDLDSDGNDEIIFTGTNNLLNGEGVIGVLPVGEFHGISPPCRIEAEFSNLAARLRKYIADENSPGNQLVYLRFKKTAYLPKYEEYYNNTELVYFDKQTIHFRLYPWRIEPGTDRFGFDYVFNPDFSLREVLEQPLILESFSGFQQNGDIDISLEKLKDIYSGIVQRWDNGTWIPVEIRKTN